MWDTTEPRTSGPRQLLFVMINTIPRFNAQGGCRPCVQVWKGAEMVLCVKEEKYVRTIERDFAFCPLLSADTVCLFCCVSPGQLPFVFALPRAPQSPHDASLGVGWLVG